MYNGLIYIKPDRFFFVNSAHVLNQEGEQCGLLKFMVKIVEKEIFDKGEERDVKEVEQKEPVRVDLVAKVSIYGAVLVVNSYYLTNFNKKKRRNLSL